MKPRFDVDTLVRNAAMHAEGLILDRFQRSSGTDTAYYAPYISMAAHALKSASLSESAATLQQFSCNCGLSVDELAILAECRAANVAAHPEVSMSRE